jgi:hypothetical protein
MINGIVTPARSLRCPLCFLCSAAINLLFARLSDSLHRCKDAPSLTCALPAADVSRSAAVFRDCILTIDRVMAVTAALIIVLLAASSLAMEAPAPPMPTASAAAAAAGTSAAVPEALPLAANSGRYATYGADGRLRLYSHPNVIEMPLRRAPSTRITAAGVKSNGRFGLMTQRYTMHGSVTFSRSLPPAALHDD